jgi:tryptophan synthase alpha chain
MSRIAAKFAALKGDGEKGLIPFITAGDPDLETTEALLIELGSAGAAVIELGVPFSDPMADGPVIQRASERALKHGFGIPEILATVARARKRIETPIVLFSYFNPLLQFGPARLAEKARNAGVDGILVTDLTPEESADFAASVRENDLDLIFLVAPTSTDERLRLITKHASGFVYAVSRRGVTGVQRNVNSEAKLLVERVRGYSEMPVAVGFGITTKEHVTEVWTYADAAVVGSAIVAEIERQNGARDLVSHVSVFMKNLILGNSTAAIPRNQ